MSFCEFWAGYFRWVILRNSHLARKIRVANGVPNIISLAEYSMSPCVDRIGVKDMANAISPNSAQFFALFVG